MSEAKEFIISVGVVEGERFDDLMAQAERQIIGRLLEYARNNKIARYRLGEMIGLSDRQIARKIDKYGLNEV